MRIIKFKNGESIEIGNFGKIQSCERMSGITLKNKNGTRVQFLKSGESAEDIRIKIVNGELI